MRSPEVVIHRVNRRAQLRGIPKLFGVEVDLRSQGSQVVLNHEPFAGGERFADWLDEYTHGLLVLNIKEAGIEGEVIRLTEERGVARFFLLDVEFPYIYQVSRIREHRIAMRYSEDEAIQTVENYRGKVDWVWIDTMTRLPLDAETAVRLSGFQTCLVCPGRWGRPQDIPIYRRRLAELQFTPDAVMTSLGHASEWTLCLDPGS